MTEAHKVPKAPGRFDAYSASVEGSHRPVLDLLASFAHGEPVSFQSAHYEGGLKFRDYFGNRVGDLKWGGRNKRPHVEISGDRTPELVEAFRSAFPDHWVSRADSCWEFGGEGVFERADGFLVSYAQGYSGRGRRLAIDQRGDWVNPWPISKGRTRYLGSPAGAGRVRWYEKEKETRARRNSTFGGGDLNHSRLEIQVRPGKIDKAIKARAATLDPFEMTGLISWVGPIMLRFLEAEPAYIPPPRVQTPTLHQSARALCLNYKRTLIGLRDELGTPCAVGAFLFDVLESEAD